MKNQSIRFFAILFFSLSLFSASAAIRIVEVQQPQIGTSNGAIEVEATGNAGPFSIDVVNLAIGSLVSCSMVNFDGIFECNGLEEGSYAITVIDAYGCESYFVQELYPLDCNVQFELKDQTHVSSCDECAGTGCSNDGRLEVDFQFLGIPGYSFTWTNVATGNVISQDPVADNLAEGIYNIKISNPNHPDCVYDEDYTIGVCSKQVAINEAPFCKTVDTPIEIQTACASAFTDSDVNGNNARVNPNVVDLLSDQLFIYPNPFKDGFILKWDNQNNYQFAKLRIMTISQSLVVDMLLELTAGVNTFNIDALEDHPGGVYILHLSNQDEILGKERIIKIQ